MRELVKFLLILISFNFSVVNDSFPQTSTLSKETRIERAKYVLVNGEPTIKNIKLAKQLLICSTIDELYSLLKSDKPNVICFACWILAKKGDLIVESKCNELSSIQENKGLFNINKTKRKSSFLQIETTQSFVCNYLQKEKYLRLLD